MSASRISSTAHTSMSDRHAGNRTAQQQKAARQERAQKEYDREAEEDEAQHASTAKQAQSSWQGRQHVDRTA